MTVAECIIYEARERGIEHFFGIPGSGGPLDLIEHGRRRGMRFVGVAHESAAPIMAGYYGLLRGAAGLALCIRGVGAGNLTGGLVNAGLERLPSVCVCEAVPAALRSYPMIQNVPHDRLFCGIAKGYHALAEATAAQIIAEAFDAAAGGRPGPVVLDLPADAVAVEAGEAQARSQPARATRFHLEAAAAFLERSRRPAILAGADVVREGATDALLSFAARIGAAVMVTMDARGAFPESHPRWAGVFEGFFNPHVIEAKVLEAADALLVVGADALMTHSPWQAALPVCELSADPAYPPLVPGAAVRLSGDLRRSLRDWPAASRAGFSEQEIRQLWRAVEPHFARPPGARFAAQDIIAISRRLLPQDGRLFSETGAYIVMLETLWKVDRPGTYFGTSGGRTMGQTLPAMVGARLADGRTPMMGIGADGSALMRLGELETVARTGAVFPLVVINDGAWGTIKSRQRSRGLPDCGMDLYPVDFAAVARACGLRGVTVRSPEAFERELAAAFDADAATLIDARIDAESYQRSFGPTIGILQ